MRLNIFQTILEVIHMLEKTLLVVSDKFHHFAMKNDVITKSDLCSILCAENLIFPELTKINLMFGQGFSEEALEHIKKLLSTSEHAKNFDLKALDNVPKRASKQLTHKHKEENILISHPKRQSACTFKMDMLIDENCEMMADHQTGLHIQGMILVEAARQASMAVIEHFLVQNTDEKLYFLFNNLNVNYNRFAFPLPTTLIVTIKKRDETKEKRRHYIMGVDVIQCDNISASLLLDGTMMPDKRVLNMENRFANQSLDDYGIHIANSHIKKHTQTEVIHA